MSDIKSRRQISLIMVTYNSYPFFEDALNLLQRHIVDIDIEYIIVDNKSPDKETHKCLDDLKAQNNPLMKVVKLDNNSGYSTAMNIGVNYASFDTILTFDNDVFVDADANAYFVEMYDLLQKNLDYGLISPLFNKEDGTPDINYFIKFNIYTMLYERFSRIFSDKSKYDSLDKLSEQPKDDNGCIGVRFVAGQFFLMRKSVYFNIVKGWDTRYFLGVSDTDVCETLNFYGLKNVIYPKANLVHGGSKSNNRAPFIVTFENYKTFAQYILKWNIFPFVRTVLYRILFSLPAYLEMQFRKVNNNKNVSD